MSSEVYKVNIFLSLPLLGPFHYYNNQDAIVINDNKE